MVCMGEKSLKMPKQIRCQKRGKITAYPAFEIEELYRLGKTNGWDVASIAKDALEEAFRARADELAKRADAE